MITTIAINIILLIFIIGLNICFFILADSKKFRITAICLIFINLFSCFLSQTILTKGCTDYYETYYQEIDDRIKIEEKQRTQNLSFSLQEKIIDKNGKEKYVYLYNEFDGQEFSFTTDKPIPDETFKYETHIDYIKITYPYNIKKDNISFKDDMTNSIRYEYEIPALNISWSDGTKKELIEKYIKEYKTTFKEIYQAIIKNIKEASLYIYAVFLVFCILGDLAKLIFDYDDENE